ncbi:MAG TPA: Rpn family recombination-promoting nuclease/putative transposase [Bacillus bacterium]|nr:Rpn family recombination-promoting nuclease/putative transposase [Bacillus sp. (in: firmicutes)]
MYDFPAPYIDHDRLFKELLQNFFQEFVELFFPEHYIHIDFSHLKFLSQELFTDIVKGEKRKIDILAETKLKDIDALILIHVEPQSYFQKEFHERMFIYFSRLYEKYRKPIFPIAIFSYNDNKEVSDYLIIEIPTFKMVEFRYSQIHLIKMDWRKFIGSNNPVAATLLSKMGYRREERIQVKLEFLRMISRMELNPAKMELLFGFFETYLQLNEEEEKLMQEEITRLPEEDAKAILRLPNSYFEKGLEQGIEKGMEKGIEKIVREMYKKGLPEELISELSKLPIEQIREIKQNINDFS